jgi:diaminohydroxyphosphoribosylaminopyrimidine deaminase/5-amino-6-(5-phosphoribosylamino)uracil reductase
MSDRASPSSPGHAGAGVGSEAGAAGAAPGSEEAAASAAELAAMRRALALAASSDVVPSPNPRVGCVLLDPAGRTVAAGFHRGAGTPHAEVDALRQAGGRARGGTAVVTLEPCAHTGRTGPCADALLAAGVARVVYGQADPNQLAAGGAARLAAGGVAVVGGVLAEEASALNAAWTFAVTHGRPFVTWKVAATLDGRVAAADGTSRWITGAAARADVHRLRAEVDAVLVGTGTALVDDPSLTVRAADGSPGPCQPLRVVMGMRAIPDGSRLRDGLAPLRVLATHDPAAALAALAAEEVRHVLLEGGPTVAAAFLRAGLVDRVVWYLAPALLGAGPAAIDDLGIATITGIRRLRVATVDRVGHDLRITATMEPEPHD